MKYLNYFLILIGAATAFYSDSFNDTNSSSTVLIIGMAIMMVGIYRISRQLPSKSERDNSEDNK